jgi:hypothetical protein
MKIASMRTSPTRITVRRGTERADNNPDSAVCTHTHMLTQYLVLHLRYAHRAGRLPFKTLSQIMRAHCSIFYFRQTGCFVPIHQMYRDDGCEWHVARCVYAPLDGRQRVVVLHNDKVCEEDGFMVNNAMRPENVAHMSASSISGRGQSARPAAGMMYAFIGAHGKHRFTTSPLHYEHLDPDYVISFFQSLNLPPEYSVGLAELLHEGAEQISASLLTAVQQLLGEDFPAPRRRIGILIPRQPVEQQVLELQLLQALVEIAAADTDKSGAAARVLQQIEAEAQADIGEIIQAGKRALMDRLIQEQLAEHAAAVRRSQGRHTGGVQHHGVSTGGAVSVAKSTLPPAAASKSILTSSAASSAAATLSPLTVNLQQVEELLSHRRSKNRVVIAVLMRFLQSLSRHTPLMIINKAGSHRTAHFDHFSSLTLVEAHGRKDSTVGRWMVTRIAERLMQMAVRLGLTS